MTSIALTSMLTSTLLGFGMYKLGVRSISSMKASVYPIHRFGLMRNDILYNVGGHTTCRYNGKIGHNITVYKMREYYSDNFETLRKEAIGDGLLVTLISIMPLYVVFEILNSE